MKTPSPSSSPAAAAPRRRRALFLGACTLLTVASVAGCELIVDFDRTKIPADVPDVAVVPGVDAQADTTPPPVDSAVDAPVDSAVDAPVDSAVDAPVDSAADAPVDSAVDAGSSDASDAG
ncbi:MAG TPA: hypothetical protein PLR99_31760 [Polyangiaceae bacterium]|nr:hypothetical protein [Polyangiaceae bacterium]